MKIERKLWQGALGGLAAVLAVLGAASSMGGCDQPEIDCRAARGDFAVTFTLVEGECGGLTSGFVGLQSYYPTKDGKQDYEHPYLTIQTEFLGIISQTSQYFGPEFVDTENTVYSKGDFATAKPEEGVCSVPTLTPAQQDIPEVPGEETGGGGAGAGGAAEGGAGGGTGGAAEGGAGGMGGAAEGGAGEGGAGGMGEEPACPEPEPEGPFEGQPAIDIKVEWSNVKVYVTAQSPGTQFVGDMTYTEDIDGVTCTAKYRVLGIWPYVECGVYEYDECGNLISATPDDSLCHLDPATAPPGSVLIDPAFDTVCDPDLLYCVAATPVDALK